MRHLDPSTPGEVPVVVELFLELKCLMSRVRRSCPLSVDAVRSVCLHTNKTRTVTVTNMDVAMTTISSHLY